MKKFRTVLCFLALLLFCCTPVHAETRKMTVSFQESSGEKLPALTKRVTKNKYFFLPQLPEKEGWQNVGWSLKKWGKNASVLPAGSRMKVSRNRSFYAVRRKITSPRTLSFYAKDGSQNEAYQKLGSTVEKGTAITLPSMPNNGCMRFLGWARTKGKSTGPDYRAGETLKLTRSMRLYAVYFNCRKRRTSRLRIFRS